MNRRIVYVKWLDHQSSDESTEFDEEVGPATFYSVGFLTAETPDWIEISRDMRIDDDEPTQKEACLCLLKGCIVLMKDLT